MVTDTSAELAEVMGAPAEELVAFGNADAGGVDGLGLVYQVSEADKAAWRPAWKMEIGLDGKAYGKPIKLPVNINALANYLKKRRKDGGQLFTLRMPEHILGPGEFPCFVAPNDCSKKAPTKGLLVDHMEGCHPKECAHYAPFIQQIRDSIASENPALQSMVDKIIGTPDRQAVVMPEEVRVEHDATVPEIAPLVVEDLTIVPVLACPMCDYKTNAEHKRPQMALDAHMRFKHKE